MVNGKQKHRNKQDFNQSIIKLQDNLLCHSVLYGKLVFELDKEEISTKLSDLEDPSNRNGKGFKSAKYKVMHLGTNMNPGNKPGELIH